jgi:hypothetical protein
MLAYLAPFVVHYGLYALGALAALAVLLLIFGRHGWWIAMAAVMITLMCSCSTQVMTTPEGNRLVNNNLISKGALIRQPDGTIIMTGDSEKAGEYLAKHLRMAAMIGLAGQGVEAMKDVGVKALNQQ